MRLREGRAFTLIELLIVVAIIAILAAIAVPNFLEAQVRSKVSRAKADQRSIATAVESYAIDYNRYPRDHTSDWTGSGPGAVADVPKLVLSALTTPVAFITSVPKSAFVHQDPRTELPKETPKGAFPDEYFYVGEDWTDLMIQVNSSLGARDKGRKWALSSWGPDRKWNTGEWFIFGEEVLNGIAPMNLPAVFGVSQTGGSLYDATNGTISDGDIVRVGP